MTDKLTIIGKDGKPRYVVDEFSEITDLIIHQHEFIEGICACGAVREIQTDGDQAPQ